MLEGRLLSIQQSIINNKGHIMNIIVRRETEKDYRTTEYVVEKAFEKLDSKHDEHFLVANLRKSAAFVPELSLMAEFEGEVVGRH